MSRSQSVLQKSLFLSLFAVASFSARPAFAGIGTSLMRTAPIMEPGKFEAKLQNDIILNNGGGFNISPHLSLGLVEHYLDLDSWVATGTTDFQIGSMGKYNILPDLEGQIALSILAGLSFIKDEGMTSFLTSFGFVASKSTPLSFAHATPYAALQVEALINSGDSKAPISLALGSKWDFPDMKWGFYSELGVNLHESLWTIGLGVSHPF